MLQTAKKILTSTKFHLWDVLKLKKRIIFLFRLFCSTFGHLKKKSPNFAQKQQKSHIFEISNFDLRPESGRYVAGRSAQSPSLSKIFFMRNGQKLTNLSQKNIPPQKGPFFGGGGGSATRWSLRTKCLGLDSGNFLKNLCCHFGNLLKKLMLPFWQYFRKHVYFDVSKISFVIPKIFLVSSQKTEDVYSN